MESHENESSQRITATSFRVIGVAERSITRLVPATVVVGGIKA